MSLSKIQSTLARSEAVGEGREAWREGKEERRWALIMGREGTSLCASLLRCLRRTWKKGEREEDRGDEQVEKERKTGALKRKRFWGGGG